MKLRYLGNAPFFSALSEQERERLAQRMYLEHRRGGEVLFKQGDESTALYLIKSGWVRLLANGGTVLASQGPGSLVGETDVFLERARTLGAATAADTELWILTRDDLVDLIGEDPKLGINLALAFGARLSLVDRFLVKHRLRMVPFLSGLDEKTLTSIARRLSPVEKGAGEFIVEEGQPPEALFIVESGLVRIHGSEEGGDFSELGTGGTFGELALLTGKAHTHAAQAATDAALWRLPASEFESLAEECPEIRLALSQTILEPLASQDKVRAGERLGAMPIFSGLSEDALWAVTERMLLRHVPAGELVFDKGAPGDALYLIDSGQVDILSHGRPGATVLATLGADEFFGEMALLTGQPRSSAARTSTHANLWVLYRSDFEDLVSRYPSISLTLSRTLSQRLADMDRRFTESHLRGMRLLSGLSFGQLEDVSGRLKPMRFRQGQVLMREGAPGDEMYFIESGRVRVERKHGRDTIVLADLGAGELVGEMALLTGSPRSATVTALSDLDVWALSQADFDELVSAYPNLALALSRLLSERLQATDARFLEQVAAPSEPAPRPTRQRAAAETIPAPRTRTAALAERAPARARRRRTRRTVPGLREVFGNAATWYGSLSRGGKVRLVLVSLLLIWLTCIAAPALVISTLAAENVTDVRGAIAFVYDAEPEAEPAPVAQNAPMVLEAGDSNLPGLVEAEARVLGMEVPLDVSAGGSDAEVSIEGFALQEQAPEEPAAALMSEGVEASLPQPEAPAAEPLAVDPPTPTPWIIVITNTPPPPTDTPEPTATPVPPTATPVPRSAPAAKPQPTATPARTQHPPRELDPRLPSLGVNVIEPSGLAAGQTYYRLISATWQNEQEAAQDHTIYIDVFDESGNRIVGQPVEISWMGDKLIVFVEDKPAPEYGTNFPMYALLGSYAVSIPGAPSDTIVGLGMGTAEQPAFKIHTNFKLKFQRTRW